MSGELDADLVMAAGQQFDLHQRQRAVAALRTIQHAEDPIAQFGALRTLCPLLHDPRPVLFRIFQQMIHKTALIIRTSPADDGAVDLPHAARLDLGAQGRGRRPALRVDHDPGNRFIQPLDNSHIRFSVSAQRPADMAADQADHVRF